MKEHHDDCWEDHHECAKQAIVKLGLGIQFTSYAIWKALVILGYDTKGEDCTTMIRRLGLKALVDLFLKELRRAQKEAPALSEFLDHARTEWQALANSQAEMLKLFATTQSELFQLVDALRSGDQIAIRQADLKVAKALRAERELAERDRSAFADQDENKAIAKLKHHA